jgi:hypothetical protein
MYSVRSVRPAYTMHRHTHRKCSNSYRTRLERGEAAAQPEGAAGGRDAAFAAHSAGNDEGPAPRASSAAHGAHGHPQHGTHKGHSSTAMPATATPPPLRRRRCCCCCRCRRWPIGAPIDVEPCQQPCAAAPTHKYNLRPMTASWVRGGCTFHVPTRHNPS